MQPHNAAVRPAQRDLAGGGEMTAQELRFRTAQKRHIGHSQEGILWGKCRKMQGIMQGRALPAREVHGTAGFPGRDNSRPYT